MEVKTRLTFVFVIVAMVPVASLSTLYSYFAKSENDSMKLIASDLEGDRTIARNMHETLTALDAKLRSIANSGSNAERIQLLREAATLRGSFAEEIALASNPKGTVSEQMLADRTFPLIDGLTYSQLEKKMANDIAAHFESYILPIDAIPSIPFNAEFKPMVNAILNSQAAHLARLHASIGNYEDLQQLTLQALAEQSAKNYQTYFVYGSLASGAATAIALLTAILISKAYHITIEEKRKSDVRTTRVVR